MRRIIACVVFVLVATVVGLVPCFAADCNLTETKIINLVALEAQDPVEIAKFNELVNQLDEDAECEDNQIVLSDKNISELSDIYGEDAVIPMIDSIEEINEMADDGELVITDNGTIYEAENNDMTVQGAYNKTDVKWRTTGKTYYYSYKDAKGVRDKYREAYLEWSAAGFVAGFVGAGLPFSITANHYQYIYEKIDDRNKKNKGVKIKTFWITSLCEVRGQDKAFQGVLS